jgi:lipoprotein-releasing system ATP-binding protein
MPILTAEHLQKTFWDSNQELKILCDINLTLDIGEFASISGQSGCGKSTLLHLLGLLDKPNAGIVKVNDAIVTADSEEANQIRNRFIGFVFQFHYLLEELSIVENVALPMMILGKSEKVCLREAHDLLEKLNMQHRASHYPNTLSGGEQQRVAIARALINKPNIILADEPTGNLDPKHSTEVMDLLLQINKDLGTAFILVTHDSSIANMAQTHYNLCDGVLQRIERP